MYAVSYRPKTVTFSLEGDILPLFAVHSLCKFRIIRLVLFGKLKI